MNAQSYDHHFGARSDQMSGDYDPWLNANGRTGQRRSIRVRAARWGSVLLAVLAAFVVGNLSSSSDATPAATSPANTVSASEQVTPVGQDPSQWLTGPLDNLLSQLQNPPSYATVCNVWRNSGELEVSLDDGNTVGVVPAPLGDAQSASDSVFVSGDYVKEQIQGNTVTLTVMNNVRGPNRCYSPYDSTTK